MTKRSISMQLHELALTSTEPSLLYM